ncbi:MAG: hypothetical protein AAF495_28885 [Pseudomonadota bacterium]
MDETTNTLLSFDEEFYLVSNPDVAQAIENGTFMGTALDHFIQEGVFEFRDPNAFFDVFFYLTNGNTIIAGVNILELYERGTDTPFGPVPPGVDRPGNNSSDPLKKFDAAFYLNANPDVKAAIEGGAFEGILNGGAFAHFVLVGEGEGRQPNGGNLPDPDPQDPGFTLLSFDEEFYLRENPDVAEAIANGSFQGTAEDHYISNGDFELRDPNAFFDVQFFSFEQGRFVIPSGPVVTLDHYENGIPFLNKPAEVDFFGTNSSDPNKQFDADFYLEANADVRMAIENGAFEGKLNAGAFAHFVLFGAAEGRAPNPLAVDPVSDPEMPALTVDVGDDFALA